MVSLQSLAFPSSGIKQKSNTEKKALLIGLYEMIPFAAQFTLSLQIWHLFESTLNISNYRFSATLWNVGFPGDWPRKTPLKSGGILLLSSVGEDQVLHNFIVSNDDLSSQMKNTHPEPWPSERKPFIFIAGSFPKWDILCMVNLSQGFICLPSGFNSRMLFKKIGKDCGQ